MPAVVLVDSDVLFSRALRDCLLNAMDEQVVNVVWTADILDDVARHLAEDSPHVTPEAASALIRAMNEYFPAAEINPSSADFARLAGLAFPDPDDRHVFAGALAAEADAICTNNTKDFPVAVAS